MYLRQVRSRYSARRLFTGLAMAALTAWKLMVNNAISAARIPASKKATHDTPMRYAKSCSHLSIANHATGNAIKAAIATSFKKSLDNNATILDTEAPSTLRMPISFVRCRVL